MWTIMSHEESFRRYGTNAGAYYVGTGGAIAAEMFVEGEVKHKGLVIPEQLPTTSFLDRLGKKNVEFAVEIAPL